MRVEILDAASRGSVGRPVATGTGKGPSPALGNCNQRLVAFVSAS